MYFFNHNLKKKEIRVGKKQITNKLVNEDYDWEWGLGCTKKAVRSLAQGLFTRCPSVLWQPKQSFTDQVA